MNFHKLSYKLIIKIQWSTCIWQTCDCLLQSPAPCLWHINAKFQGYKWCSCNEINISFPLTSCSDCTLHNPKEMLGALGPAGGLPSGHAIPVGGAAEVLPRPQEHHSFRFPSSSPASRPLTEWVRVVVRCHVELWLCVGYAPVQVWAAVDDETAQPARQAWAESATGQQWCDTGFQGKACHVYRNRNWNWNWSQAAIVLSKKS